VAYDKSKKNTKSSDKLLEVARERFRLAEEYERDVRQDGLEDLQFRAGMQWPDEVKNERSIDGRPCLVINRIPQSVRQITNDQRQNRPAIKVHPVDDKGDIETAKIYQGLIRHIEYNSSADTAYDTAFEGATIMGFGYFRITTDYVDPMSFDQEILIKRIKNPFSVYFDPGAKEPDGSDANWAFVFEDVPKDDYLAEWGDTELSKMEDWLSLGDMRQGWVSENTCRVAEYFYKEYEEKTLCLLANGSSIEKSELEALYPEGIPEDGDYAVESERKTKVPVIKWCKINGVEVLEETTWPGRWIPIIPVYGDDLEVNGKRILEGIVRHAKDSQRMYNYWASTETETIALAPKSPYVVAEGQIPREYEAMWRSANRKSHAYLPYKPVDHKGQLAPPPQRQTFEPPVMAITNARRQASEDLKATTGIYDAALGAQSNETSGVAIARRNMQSQTSNFHLIDNLTRSIKHCGRILVDLIPKVYDTERAARIIGEEGDQEIVRLNAEFEPDSDTPSYMLNRGKYDVAIETGPSFATKRMEAAASMENMIKAYPALMQAASDLIVKNMDWPGAQEIAERLKKMLPPELQDTEEQQLPPQVQAQMQQMNQMIEQLTESLNAANDDIKQKRIELESRERIEFAKMNTDLEKEKLRQAAAFAVDDVNAKIDAIQQRLTMLGIDTPFSDQEGMELMPQSYGPGPDGMGPQGTEGLGPFGPPEFSQQPAQPVAPDQGFGGVDDLPPTDGITSGPPMEDY
jgi:hypothetical protein